MRKLLCCLFVAGVLAAVLGGCHTIEGVGKDIKAGGEAIEEIAK